MEATKSECTIVVDHGATITGPNGRSWVGWRGVCGEPVHKSGRCLGHHNAHVALLLVEIANAQAIINRNQDELNNLTD